MIQSSASDYTESPHPCGSYAEFLCRAPETMFLGYIAGPRGVGLLLSRDDQPTRPAGWRPADVLGESWGAIPGWARTTKTYGLPTECFGPHLRPVGKHAMAALAESE